MKRKSMGKVLALTPEVMRNRTTASKIVNEAADVLGDGGLVIMPTETAYGIAADATNDDAVKQVFAAKGRHPDKPMPILVSDRYMIEEYAELSALAHHFMDAFMPGPLSLVVPMKAEHKLAPSLSQKGIAFRIPGNDFARAIVAELGKPVTTTSANISGEEPLYVADQVKATFQGKVNLILDRGDLSPTMPSTVLDLQGDAPQILRRGPISDEQIQKAIEEFAAQAVATA